MNSRNKGQALLFTLVLLPLMILILGIYFRSGMTAWTTQRVQRYTDQRTLDILAIQANALENLGRLNPYARTIINTKRAIDVLLASSVLNPLIIPQYIRARWALIKAQKTIENSQKLIMTSAKTQILMKINEPLPSYLRGRVQIKHPLKPLPLYVESEKGYEGETGAPKVLTQGFPKTQNLELQAKINTESFLSAWKPEKNSPWPHFTKQNSVQLSSFAQIEMENIESDWTVKLKEKPMVTTVFRGASL